MSGKLCWVTCFPDGPSARQPAVRSLLARCTLPTHLAGGLVEWLAGPPLRWPAGPPACWLAGAPAGPPARRPAGCTGETAALFLETWGSRSPLPPRILASVYARARRMDPICWVPGYSIVLYVQNRVGNWIRAVLDMFQQISKLDPPPF